MLPRSNLPILLYYFTMIGQAIQRIWLQIAFVFFELATNYSCFQVQSIKVELNYLFSFNPLYFLNTNTRSYLFSSFYLFIFFIFFQRFQQLFSVCMHSSNISNVFFQTMSLSNNMSLLKNLSKQAVQSFIFKSLVSFNIIFLRQCKTSYLSPW